MKVKAKGNMEARALLQATADLYESLERSEWDGASFRGKLLFDVRWHGTLAALEGDARIELRYKEQTITALQLQALAPVGEQVTVRVTPPNGPDAFFAKDFDALLEIPTSRYHPPESFYLADERILFPRDSARIIQSYREAVELVNLLREVADHSEVRPRGLWLVFLSSEGKVEIPVAYKSSDLSLLQHVEEFRESVTEPPHAKVKRGIFRNVVTGLTTNVSTPDRLRVLFSQFPELNKRFGDNLELYLKEFSFETERERIETLKREYMLKLNGAVGDIHAKLIAIPAAVVLVAGQMKVADSAATLISNTVLLAGAIVFAVLMFMLTANQKHSLTAIRVEFTQRRDRLKNEIPKLFADLEASFDELEKRHNLQNKLLAWINWLVGIGLLCSAAVFILYLLVPEPAEAPRSLYHLLARGGGG